MRISDWSSDVCSSDLAEYYCRGAAWFQITRDRKRLERCLGFGIGLMRDDFLLSLAAKVAVVERSTRGKPLASEFPDNQQIGTRRNITPKFSGILLERASLLVQKNAQYLCHGPPRGTSVAGRGQ